MSFARSLSLLSSRLPSSFASSSRRAYSTPSPSEPPSPQKAGLTTERWQHPPSSTPEGTPIPSVVILKNQPVPVAMADDAYPGWLWKLIGEGKELVAQGKESAERGEEWDARAERRKMRSINRENIKLHNLMSKKKK